MRLFAEVWERLRALLFRHREDRELDEELRFHLERETEKHIEAGMDAREARRQAHLRFGGVERFKEDHDDYNAIMLEALADRLAEALAEFLHQKVRREWGYGGQEKLSREELIQEAYQGIRPAAGYPSCPDHTEKATLFELLDAPNSCGVELSSNFAMTPAAAVSGFYFSHPESRYFAVGKISKDQVESLAGRNGRKVAEMERWLAPNLIY